MINYIHNENTKSKDLTLQILTLKATKAKKICVLGLGYIGLPTASIFATHGFNVVGVDINGNVVSKLKKGEPHVDEPGLKTMVEAAMKSGNLIVQDQPGKADAYIIAVPTPITIDKKANLSFVKAAAESIVPVLGKGNLVILESTCPPGTTENFLIPILAGSGLAIGEDLYVAHCPERVLPGKILKELVENDRVIGGINPESAAKAKELYGAFVEGEIFLTDATTAEMVKLMENTYRDVNVALANELSTLCERLNIDAWEVIELANRHPRVKLHKPGPGVGGHCLPVDPWFIVEKFPEEAQLIRLSREINDAQPKHVFKAIEEATRGLKEPKVTVLGVTYKGNVDDTRESPARELIHLLRERDYAVAAYDPHVSTFEVKLDGLEEAFRSSDCAVVMADHDEFKYLDLDKLGKLMRTKQVLDTRNILDLKRWQEAGFRAKLLGRGK